MNKNTAVFGIFATRAQAEGAVDALVHGGFTPSAISVLLAEGSSTKGFAHEKTTKVPEGATAGAVAGGTIGGGIGLLVGVGVMAIPGLGPFIAAGPIMTTLAGLGAGGAVGGIVGALVGMGIPESEAKGFEGGVKSGGVLLSAHCDTQAEVARAKALLKSLGARDITSAGEEVTVTVRPGASPGSGTRTM